MERRLRSPITFSRPTGTSQRPDGLRHGECANTLCDGSACIEREGRTAAATAGQIEKATRAQRGKLRLGSAHLWHPRRIHHKGDHAIPYFDRDTAVKTPALGDQAHTDSYETPDGGWLDVWLLATAMR